MEKQLEQLETSIDNLEYQIQQLDNLFKCDITGINVAQAINELAFELKRYNDKIEKK